MAKGIVIPADEAQPMRVIDVRELSDLQFVVGGYIQPAPIERDDFSLYCDEEGKLKGYPLNQRADILWGAFLPEEYRMPGDHLVGDCVLASYDEEAEGYVDVPEFLLDQLKL
ncbi:DUF3846 domain-containing protein [Kineococcus sp. NPDC059986]|uniref:DUF3846 domain-containing protein n=1 Tax=Actinomycetes TaxID=1760 RepID=UPI0034500016